MTSVDETSVLKKRFQSPQKIYVYAGGVVLSDRTPCFTFELNALIDKYYVYQPGSSQFREMNLDIKIQKRMLKQALGELVDQVSDALSPTEPGTPQAYNKLFTVEGACITSLLDIPPDCHQLIACKDAFSPPDVREFISNAEKVESFADRMVAGT